MGGLGDSENDNFSLLYGLKMSLLTRYVVQKSFKTPLHIVKCSQMVWFIDSPTIHTYKE